MIKGEQRYTLTLVDNEKGKTKSLTTDTIEGLTKMNDVTSKRPLYELIKSIQSA